MKFIEIPNLGHFHKLKPDCVHMKCKRCGNIKNNVKRSEFDPSNAVVILINYCYKCDEGGGFEESWYFDINGKEIGIEEFE